MIPSSKVTLKPLEEHEGPFPTFAPSNPTPAPSKVNIGTARPTTIKYLKPSAQEGAIENPTPTPSKVYIGTTNPTTIKYMKPSVVEGALNNLTQAPSTRKEIGTARPTTIEYLKPSIELVDDIYMVNLLGVL
jgi:hypothetical protein